mgnify:FL=1
MEHTNKLAELFSRFPGIGQRQAKRFVFFLLSQDQGFVEDLARQMSNLKKTASTCGNCFRFFFRQQKEEKLCKICRDTKRENTLMIVSREIDLENIEKSGIFSGKYFVLGGTIPILDKPPFKKLRMNKLLEKVDKAGQAGELKEIIIAMDFNPEGENTTIIVKRELSALSEKYKFNISSLGKGLSLGTELEYSDPETIKNALQGRH